MSDAILDQASRVSLVLNGTEELTAKGYEVVLGMFDHPNSFSVDFGSSKPPYELMAKYPANTKFELYVGGVKQFSGRTDGWVASGGSGGTHLHMRGRDSMAALVDAHVMKEVSWSDLTYADLTTRVLAEAVQADVILEFGNEADRQARTGSKVGEKGVKSSRRSKKTDDKGTFQAKMGQSWHDDVLRPALDRAGLFLIAGIEENFFRLTTPSLDQDVFTQIVHQRGSRKNTVIDWRFRNEASARVTRCDVHGRRGAGKEARSKVLGTYEDTELKELGIARPFAFSDDKCTTTQQAEHLARLRVTEMRRKGWALEYVVRGHAVRGFQSTQPNGLVVWSPDVLVQVDDNELEIHEVLYLEEVTLRGAPHFTTQLRFMRVDDVVFGKDA